MDKNNNIKGIYFRDFKTSFIPHILKELYMDRVYDPYLLNKKDLVILDIGANVGLFSFYAHPYAKKIYALEPSKSHVEVMKAMLESNGIEDKVEVVPVALSINTGTARFYTRPDNVTMNSLSSAATGDKEFEDVETVSFDELFKRLNLDWVDFVKLDIEGSECEVIGSEGFDKVSDKIGVIMGEYHNWSMTNPEQLKTYFLDRGFSFAWVNKTEASLFIAQRSRK